MLSLFCGEKRITYDRLTLSFTLSSWKLHLLVELAIQFMKPEDMRSLNIETSLNGLKELKDWDYEEKNIGGMNHHVLKHNTNEIEIIVIEESENKLYTSNILTQDGLDVKPKLKDDQIMKLAKSLEDQKIGYSLNVSDNDKKKL